MNETTTEAASPASNTGDGEKSGNVSLGQAAAMLFAKEQKAVQPKAEPAPSTEEVATEEPAAPETTEQSGETAESETVTSESEPAAEAEAAEPEAEKEEEEVPSKKTSSDKEARIREKVQKRVDEEVAKRKALEERLANLEASLKKAESEKANPPPPMPKSTRPLAEYTDLSSLKKYQEQAKQAKRWASDQLSRDDIGEGVQVGDQTLNREQIREVLRKAEIAIEDQIPAQENFLLAKQQASQQAVEMFPFLKDPNSEDYHAAVQAYRLNPWLQDLPNADFIVGVQVEGLKALRAKQEAASKPKAEKPKPKTIPAAKPSGDQTAVSSGTSTPRVPTASAAKNALEVQREKLRQKGAVTASEAAALLERSDKIRNLR
jgi:hypothetical protein